MAYHNSHFSRTPSRRSSVHNLPMGDNYMPGSFEEPFYPQDRFAEPYQGMPQQDFRAFQPPPGVVHAQSYNLERERRSSSPNPYNRDLSPSPSPPPRNRTPFHTESGVPIARREPTPFHPAYDEASLEDSPLLSEPETYYSDHHSRSRRRTFSSGPYSSQFAPPLQPHPSQYLAMSTPGPYGQGPVIIPPTIPAPGMSIPVPPMSMSSAMSTYMPVGMPMSMPMGAGPYMRTGAKIKFCARGASGKSGILLSEALRRGRGGVELSKSYRYRYYDLRLSPRGLLYVRVRWNGYQPVNYEIPVTVTSGDYVSMSGLARRLGRAVLHFLQSNAITISSKRVVLHRLEEETPGVWLPVFSTV